MPRKGKLAKNLVLQTTKDIDFSCFHRRGAISVVTPDLREKVHKGQHLPVSESRIPGADYPFSEKSGQHFRACAQLLKRTQKVKES
jgi:hypothetical protein